jgi:ABC-type uncharacterized transport system substrate-binding protein
MNRRLFFAALGCALWLAQTSAVTAQEKIPRIGFLTFCLSSFDEEGFRQGLSELGYVEGKTIVIEWRRFLGNVEQLRPAADELVRSKVDIIVTCSTPATRAALEATKTIPIVFTAAGDPVATGLAESLAKPGANATGVSLLSTELYPKRLDLLRQLAPHARRVAFIVNVAGSFQLTPTEAAAKALHIRLDVYNTRNAREVDAALHAIPWSSIDGVLIGGDVVALAQGAKIAQAIRKARLPAVFPWRQFHEYGVMMSYGPDSREVMRRGAYYVDRILKGARPSDLPAEQVSKVDLIIDLRMAREMGIKVPPELMYRADEVIR